MVYDVVTSESMRILTRGRAVAFMGCIAGVALERAVMLSCHGEASLVSSGMSVRCL